MCVFDVSHRVGEHLLLVQYFVPCIVCHMSTRYVLWTLNGPLCLSSCVPALHGILRARFVVDGPSHPSTAVGSPLRTCPNVRASLGYGKKKLVARKRMKKLPYPEGTQGIKILRLSWSFCVV